MKKIAITIVFLFVFTTGMFAQGGGLFQYGATGQHSDWNSSTNWNSGWNDRDTFTIGLIGFSHGLYGDNDPSPLGSGALLLVGFGAAYALRKRKQKQ